MKATNALVAAALAGVFAAGTSVVSAALSTEQTIFAENAVQYRTTLSFLEGRINTVMQALKGE